MRKMQEKVLMQFESIIWGNGKKHIEMTIQYHCGNMGTFFVQPIKGFVNLMICHFDFQNEAMGLKFSKDSNEIKSYYLHYKNGDKVDEMFEWFKNTLMVIK